MVLSGYHLAQKYENAKLRALIANWKVSLNLEGSLIPYKEAYITYSWRIEKIIRTLIIKVNGLRES